MAANYKPGHGWQAQVNPNFDMSLTAEYSPHALDWSQQIAPSTTPVLGLH